MVHSTLSASGRSCCPWVLPGDAHDRQLAPPGVDLLQLQVRVVASHAVLEPLVEKGLSTTKPILDRLRNGLHEFALFAGEGEGDEELLWNGAFRHGSRLPGILLASPDPAPAAGNPQGFRGRFGPQRQLARTGSAAPLRHRWAGR